MVYPITISIQEMYFIMNAVGIDVSKGKSTVAVLRPFGEVVASPFDVAHTGSDLKILADFIKKLPGERKVVMEATGNSKLTQRKLFLKNPSYPFWAFLTCFRRSH